MNTIETYFQEQRAQVKVSKAELLRRTEILSDIVQSLMDRMGEKEGIQLGVMATPSEDPSKGVKFVLYEQPLLKKDTIQ